MTLRMIDTFSGIGGFSLAARWLGGIKTVQFVEREPFCQRVLAKHWPTVPIHDDILGRFSGGTGNLKSASGSNRASSLTVRTKGGKMVKGELGQRGRRIRDTFKPNQLTENGDMWTKRRAKATTVQGSRPKGTMYKRPGR